MYCGYLGVPPEKTGAGLFVPSPAAAQSSRTAGFPLQSLTRNLTRMTKGLAPLLHLQR